MTSRADGAPTATMAARYSIAGAELTPLSGSPTKVNMTRPAMITIAPATGGIELRIADDGGRERREAVLNALAERAAELNGTFACETTDAGTSLAVRLPPSAAQL